jgi:hypothetical protein
MNDLSKSNAVWCHHKIKSDSGFRFLRESISHHRQYDGRPLPAGMGVEIVAYEPTESGPQRYFYLVSTIVDDGIGEPVERPGYPCVYVDPLTLTAPPSLEIATANAQSIMRERNQRALGRVLGKPATAPKSILSRWWKGLMK